MKTPAEEEFEMLEASADVEEFEEEFTEFQEDEETAEKAIGLMKERKESLWALSHHSLPHWYNH